MLESELNNKVVGEQGNITCLCPDAYTGSRCEVELKSQDERKWISQRSNLTSVHLTRSMGIVCQIQRMYFYSYLANIRYCS